MITITITILDYLERLRLERRPWVSGRWKGGVLACQRGSRGAESFVYHCYVEPLILILKGNNSQFKFCRIYISSVEQLWTLSKKHVFYSIPVILALINTVPAPPKSLPVRVLPRNWWPCLLQGGFPLLQRRLAVHLPNIRGSCGGDLMDRGGLVLVGGGGGGVGGRAGSA